MNNVFKTVVIYIKQIVILCNPKQIGKCKQLYQCNNYLFDRDHRGRARMVVEFTTYAISTYHH